MNDAPPRVRWGWPVLLALFGLLVALAVNSTFKRGAKGDGLPADRQAVATAERIVSMGAPGGSGALPVAERLATRKDPAADALRAAALTAGGGTVPKDVIARLAKSKPALAELYSKPKLNPAELARIERAIPANEPLRNVALSQARRKAGVKDPALQGTVVRLIVLVGGGIFALVAGLALWGGYLIARIDGRLTPLGHPLNPVDEPLLDRIPVRGIQLLVLFFAVSTATGLLLPAPWGLIAEVAVMIGGTIALFRIPVLARALTLSMVGLRREHLLRHVGIGVAVWLMTLPLLVAAVGVGTLLSPYFPPPDHPITEMLGKGGVLGTVSLFLTAAVMAPFWEEIMFRGLLFPGLSRLVGGRTGVAAGAVLSSLLFAAIHPQGVPLWLALGTIGGMSCFAAHHTRSLVPSVVLHAVHNGLTLILGLTVAGWVG